MTCDEYGFGRCVQELATGCCDQAATSTSGLCLWHDKVQRRLAEAAEREELATQRKAKGARW